MAETYSSRPFVSHDGVDSNGVRAEVKVVMGYGNIFEVEASDRGKASNVTFKVDNTKYKSNGWAPTDGVVIKKVKEAQELGVPIHFRIETHRKKDADRTTPISDLSSLGNAKDNIFKSLAAVRIEGEEDWTISPHALTRFDEDPSTGGNISANSQTPEQLGIGQRKAAPASSNAPAHRGIEAPPYATYNNDGSLNIGSMAVSVPLNMYSFVVEYERSHDEVTALTDKQRIVLSRVLLGAANELQMSIYDGKLDKPDMSAGSHTRARALVFEVIRTFYPITDEIVSNKESLKTWRNSVIEKALGMWRWGISEAKRVEGIDEDD